MASDQNTPSGEVFVFPTFPKDPKTGEKLGNPANFKFKIFLSDAELNGRPLAGKVTIGVRSSASPDKNSYELLPVGLPAAPDPNQPHVIDVPSSGVSEEIWLDLSDWYALDPPCNQLVFVMDGKIKKFAWFPGIDTRNEPKSPRTRQQQTPPVQTSAPAAPAQPPAANPAPPVNPNPQAPPRPAGGQPPPQINPPQPAPPPQPPLPQNAGTTGQQTPRPRPTQPAQPAQPASDDDQNQNRRNPGQPQRDNTQGNNRRGQQQSDDGEDDEFDDVKIELTGLTAVEKKKDGKLTGYDVTATVATTRKSGKKGGNRSIAAQVPFTFFVDGKEEQGLKLRTDRTGRQSHTFEDVPPGGRSKSGKFKVEAVIKGRATGDDDTINVPAPPAEDKKKDEKKLPALQVVQPNYPNSRGGFPITVKTHKDNKPAQSKFTIAASEEIELREVSSGTVHKGFTFDLETSDSGCAAYILSFDPVQVSITFLTPAGFTTDELFCKPNTGRRF